MTFEETEESIKFLLNTHLHIVMKELDRGYRFELLCESLIFWRSIFIYGMIIGSAFNRIEVMDADVFIVLRKFDTG